MDRRTEEMHPDQKADWPTIVARAREVFGGWPPGIRPRGVTGQHLMTPDVLTIAESAAGPVEVSTGHWMDGSRIFGLTWSRKPDGTSNDLDGLVHSLDEAKERIANAGRE